MNMLALQTILKDMGHYTLALDGDYGPGTRKAIMSAFVAGPKTRASKEDFAAAGQLLGTKGAEVRSVWIVEAPKGPFDDLGRPTALFEPHRFFKSTQGRFPLSAWNYPKWDRSRYPATSSARYQQLLDAIGQDVDAGFMSMSYGGPQILGENFKAAGYPDPAHFAFAMAIDEGMQMRAMINFCKFNGLADELRAHNWAGFARGYNGTAYRENKYDDKLAAAFALAQKQGY